jgi:hypothetical protein
MPLACTAGSTPLIFNPKEFKILALRECPTRKLKGTAQPPYEPLITGFFRNRKSDFFNMPMWPQNADFHRFALCSFNDFPFHSSAASSP